MKEMVHVSRRPMAPRRKRSGPTFGARDAKSAAGGFTAALLLAYFFDPQLGSRRRKLTVQRAAGLTRHAIRRVGRTGRHAASESAGLGRRAVHPRWRQSAPADDVTLARKVETEIFRPADAPKGSVNVNAVDGVIWLRGQVQRPEQARELEDHARRVVGVKEVRNLLHLPDTSARTEQ
jgi:hypothetical protein